MTKKNRIDFVSFKLKALNDNIMWENIEPIGELACEDARTAGIIAHALSGLFSKECRWNWTWSTQGQYEVHQNTLQRFLNDRNKE